MSEYGYIGKDAPTQAVLSNSGVFSVNEHKDLLDQDKILSLGQLELIQTQTFSGVGTVDFTAIKEGEYDIHFFTGVMTGNGNNRPWLRFFEEGTIETGSVYKIGIQQNTVGGQAEGNGTTTNLDFFVGSSEVGESSVAKCYIYYAGDSSKYTLQTDQGVMTSTLRSQIGGGMLPQTSKVDGFRVESSGETTLNGTLSLYGIKVF